MEDRYFEVNKNSYVSFFTIRGIQYEAAFCFDENDKFDVGSLRTSKSLHNLLNLNIEERIERLNTLLSVEQVTEYLKIVVEKSSQTYFHSKDAFNQV